MLRGCVVRPLIHLRTVNPHVAGLLASRAVAGEKLPYLARQGGQRPTAAAPGSQSFAGVSAFAFQVRPCQRTIVHVHEGLIKIIR